MSWSRSPAPLAAPMLRRTVGMLSLSLGGLLLAGDARYPEQIQVMVGQSVPLHVPFLATIGVCDDPSIVRVEVAPRGKTLQLTGLVQGRTRCAFSENPLSTRTLIDVLVLGAEPPAPVI